MNSTTTRLVSHDEMIEGMRVNIDGTVNTLDNVTNTENLSYIHDIFEDGSAVATYNLNGDTTDLGGNYDGVPHNISFASNNDRFKNAVIPDGSGSSYIDFGTSQFNGMTSFTFSSWVKLRQDTVSQCIYVFAKSWYSFGFFYNSSDNSFYCMFVDGDNNEPQSTISYTMSTDKFYHFVVMWDQISMTKPHVYIDGEFAFEFDIEPYTSTLNCSQTFIFSRYNYKISVDSATQLRIFNRTLTNDEINTLYRDDGYKVYTADITNFNLSNTPKNVYHKDGIVLDKVSSTTTEYVGTSTLNGLIKSGDSIELNGNTDAVCSDVVEENKGFTQLDLFNDNSCIVFYNLDGDVTDLSGNYNGTATNITYDTGKFGQAAVFNGSDSKIENTSLDINSYKAISFSFWMKTTTTSASAIIGFSGKNDMAIQTFDGRDCNVYFRTNLNYTKIQNFFVNDGTWHHYTFVVNDNGTKHYKDGTLIAITQQTKSDVSTNFNIGNVIDDQNNGSLYYFNGQIDQVRIFNRFLTSNEIDTLHNNEKINYQYTCTIPEQTEAPTSAKVLDRSITSTETSDTYDEVTDKFTKIYNRIEQQGRAFKYKIESDKDVEVTKITIPMNKISQ